MSGVSNAYFFKIINIRWSKQLLVIPNINRLIFVLIKSAHLYLQASILELLIQVCFSSFLLLFPSIAYVVIA